MAPKTVPSKIVIAGNSKMSLNDRFTTIPKPRVHLSSPEYPSPKYYQHVEQTKKYNARPVIRHRRFNYQQVAASTVPIKNRVTFVKTVPHHNSSFVSYGQRNFIPGQIRKPFRPNFNQPVAKQLNFRGNTNGQANNKRFVAKNLPAKKKSLAELDRELDDYMRKPKRPPITI